MEIHLWCLVKAGRAATAWDGEGAFRFGGRWNNRGVRAVYASSSLALAVLEVLVHLDPAAPLPAMRAVCARLPSDEITVLPECDFSGKVESDNTPIRFPFSLKQSREIGDNWIVSRAGVALAVPSAIVPTDRNYLINPNHPGFDRALLGPPREFSLDGRLLPQMI